MTHAISNSCGNKRGCYVLIILPYDRQPGLVLSRVYAAEYDLQTVFPLAKLPVDKKPEEERSLEKMAA